MREQSLVDPGVTVLKVFRRHMLWPENGVRSVVERPIPVQQAALFFHLAEQRSRRVRREDVEGRTLQAILFDPLRRAREDIFPVMVEAENKRAVYLNSDVVQHADAASVIGGTGRLFVGAG